MNKKIHIHLQAFNENHVGLIHFRCAWCVYINEIYVGDLYKLDSGEYRNSLPSKYTFLHKEIKMLSESQEVEDMLPGRWI